MSKFRAFSGMALMAALAAFIGSGAPAKAGTYNPVAMNGIMNPAKKAPGVWQQASTYSVPSGTTSLFYHYSCPSSLPIVVNGGFNSNSAGQSSTFTLGYNGPRMVFIEPYVWLLNATYGPIPAADVSSRSLHKFFITLR